MYEVFCYISLKFTLTIIIIIWKFSKQSILLYFLEVYSNNNLLYFLEVYSNNNHIFCYISLKFTLTTIIHPKIFETVGFPKFQKYKGRNLPKKKKVTKCKKNDAEKKQKDFIFSNICPALLRLLYFLTLMTGQAYLTIAAVVSVLGYIDIFFCYTNFPNFFKVMGILQMVGSKFTQNYPPPRPPSEPYYIAVS